VPSPETAPDPVTFKLRPLPSVPPRILLIGSSTGGPQALGAIVGRIGGIIDQAPVLITQHMPPTFTTILAEILERASGRPVREAIDGEALRAGAIYIAPGGRHLRAVRRDGVPSVALDDGPQINFCKPAVDPMFSSAAETWGSWNLALVLTGMGSDGTRGAADIVAAGGSVIAQDEDTSVVWGMPGSVSKAGLCCAVLPIDEIAAKLINLFSGGRS
jgi:two-component system, chemotaxis family, protein-glutamate methylesterase/glutaminase